MICSKINRVSKSPPYHSCTMAEFTTAPDIRTTTIYSQSPILVTKTISIATTITGRPEISTVSIATTITGRPEISTVSLQPTAITRTISVPTTVTGTLKPANSIVTSTVYTSASGNTSTKIATSIITASPIISAAPPSHSVDNEQPRTPPELSDAVMVPLAVIGGLITVALLAWACKHFKLWAKLEFKWEDRKYRRQCRTRLDSPTGSMSIELDQMPPKPEPIRLRPRSAGYPPIDWFRWRE